MSSKRSTVAKLTLSTAAVVFSLHTTFAQPPEMPPSPVNVTTVLEGSFAQPVRLTGSVEPLEETFIATEKEGIVAKIFVDEGDRVTSGTPLMELRLLPFQLDLKQSEAMALSDREKLRELQKGTRPEDIAIAKANWAESKANAEIAKRELERYDQLIRDNSISQSEYDVVKARWETANAQEQIDKANYELAVQGPRAEAIAAAEASWMASSAQAEMARDALDRATIRAPYSGIITERMVSPGSWLNDGDTVMAIQHLDRVRVAINVPESYFKDLSLGDVFDVSFDSLNGETFKGEVNQIIPSADRRSRAFPIKVAIDNKEGRLASGMLARVSLDLVDKGDKSVVIPRDAVVPSYPKPIVYKIVRRDGQAFAESVEIDTGRFFGKAVEVFGELKGGDQVVVRGNERLQPGAKVAIDTFTTEPVSMEEIDPARFFKEDISIEANGK